MPLTNPYEIDPKNYKYGMKGDQVVALQNALVFAGYDVGVVDGSFGTKTKQAIEQFEIDHAYNNTLSFAVDIRTLTMLFNQVCIEPGPTPPEPPTPTPPDPPINLDIPKGKGMFIRALSTTGSVDNLKKYIQERGLEWICVQRLWQYEDPSEDKLLNGTSWATYKQAWEETGCDLWVWGWPVPNRIDDYVNEMSETCAKWGAIGIVMDCEVPWYNHAAEATELTNKMLALGVPIGMTSYGAPWFHTKFPFAEFSKVDFGMPQIYDSENSMPEDYPTQSVEAWHQLGYAHIVPSSSAYKSAAQMTDLLSRTPVPDQSITWWDWHNANLDATGGRWDVVGGYQIPVRLPV